MANKKYTIDIVNSRLGGEYSDERLVSWYAETIRKGEENMRDILFRGKRADNGDWHEGEDIMRNTIRGKVCLAKIGEDWISVDPKTVGQYTGLKDKNGKRIFEGDIVRCGTGRICKVTFFISPGVSGFDLVPIGGFDAPPPHNWSLFADTEVIGNIHDNPELGIKR